MSGPDTTSGPLGALRRRLPASGFLAGVVTLMMGTALAQVIPMVIAPFLTRVYEPADFGLLSLFTSVAAVCGVVACARYELAIVLPEEEGDAAALAQLCWMVAVGLSTMLLAVLLPWSDEIAAALGNPAIESWLFLIPPVVLLTGGFNTLTYLATRVQEFALLARARVAQAAAGNGAQLLLGLAVAGPAGLLVGNSLSFVVAIGALVRSARQHGTLTRVSLAQTRRVARRYRDFPKYSIASGLAQAVALLVVSVFLTRFYSPDSLGQYALVMRVLALPLSVIAGSVGQVFFQRASVAVRDSGTMLPVFMRTLRALAVVSATSSVLLFLVLPSLFGLVFGSDWTQAGVMARSLLPGFAVQFVVAPLTLSNLVNEKVRLGLVGDLTMLAVIATVLITAASLGASVTEALLAMSIAQACYYAGYLAIILRHVRAGRPGGSS